MLVTRKCLNCNNHFPNRIEINGKIKNISNRKYCLVCSPFGKHNTKRIHVLVETKVCFKCKETYSVSDFYRKDYGYTTYCKKCHNNLCVERFRDFKKRCVLHKGGKCEKCRYDKCIAALEFHHLDPTQKDFTISDVKKKVANWQLVVKELDKCIMVCANCHREIHEEINTPGAVVD